MCIKNASYLSAFKADTHYAPSTAASTGTKTVCLDKHYHYSNIYKKHIMDVVKIAPEETSL